MKTVRIVLVGFGSVGQALGRLLLSKRDQLEMAEGIAWRVVAIATGRHGRAVDPEGIDLNQALSLISSAESLEVLSRRPAPSNVVALIRSLKADVLFDNTPVDYQTGQPAILHLQTALESGMHAITANKGPVVHAYRELTALATNQGRRFLFESTVMDGAPIFSLWRESLPAASLLALRGVLNSTTNLILTEMESGASFPEAVARAQAIGIAETDPRGDIEGWDAAVKVAALVTVLMDTPLKPMSVVRRGIENLTSEDIAAARRAGRRWKLICRAERRGDNVFASVEPEQVEPADPLYHVSGTSSAVTFHTDVLGPLTIHEDDPGPETTAYGLLADMLYALRSSD